MYFSLTVLYGLLILLTWYYFFPYVFLWQIKIRSLIEIQPILNTVTCDTKKIMQMIYLHVAK